MEYEKGSYDMKTKSNVVTATGPNTEGEMLWCVHFASSYYDNDSRMPGTTPVDCRVFVLAKTREEAIKKAAPEIKKADHRSDKSADKSIEATVVAIENLIPCRNCSDDGRLGWNSTSKFAQVTLFSPVDRKRYRLGVALIPID